MGLMLNCNSWLWGFKMIYPNILTEYNIFGSADILLNLLTP